MNNTQLLVEMFKAVAATLPQGLHSTAQLEDAMETAIILSQRVIDAVLDEEFK